MQQYSITTQCDTPLHDPGVPSATVTQRHWLEQWPVARRSLISNLFHSAVREGATTPALVVHAVQAALARRLRYGTPPRHATDETLYAVWQALQIAPQDAYAYAQSVLDWESLPRAERERQKQERGRHFQQQYMAQLPVTPQQQVFLQKLGHQGARPANRAEASSLIDGLLSARGKGRPCPPRAQSPHSRNSSSMRFIPG
jgi:hypothetical protein